MKFLENIRVANHMDDRHIYSVIPMGNGFLFRNVAFPIDAHKITMDSNMLQHAVETVWNGQFNISIRFQCIERSSFKELHFRFENYQIFRPDICSEVDTCGTFTYFGFNVGLALLACDGDAVMSIHYEVDLTHFV